MNKAVFWDLQGTLGGNAVSNIKEFEPYQFAKEALSKAKDLGFLNIVVTNQSGIAKGMLTIEEYERERDRILADLNSESVLIDDFLCCPHSRAEGCHCKKPKTGMLDEAAKKYDLDISSCFVIGDMGMNEIVMAKNAGCPGILVLTGAGCGSLGEFRDTWKDYEADFIAENALEAVRIIGEIKYEQ